jgi:molybdate transport system regulatory protein
MKYGARNRIQAKVKSVKKGDVMSLVKFTVTEPHDMASVLTTESVNDLKLKAGEQVELIIKAIHVLPVKD